MRQAERGAEDLVLLRLGGKAYTQKPPLYFWLAAGLGELRGGVDAFSARMPSALAGLATLGVWIVIARRLFPGTPIAWMTAALLLTSFRFIHFARRAQLDVLLTLFESAALLGFVLWRDAADGRARTRALVLIHGATALAVLTKGPVGLLPWACFAAVLAAEGRRPDIRRVLPITGVAAALVPVLVWIAASVALAPDGFFQVAVVENLWSRFAAGTAHVRPIWYFVYQLPVEALPWSLLWPLPIIQLWRMRRAPRDPARLATQSNDEALARRLLIAWIALPVVFFSLSAGKRGVYLLPILPATCLAVAWGLEHVRARSLGAAAWIEGPAVPAIVSALLSGVAIAAGPWRPTGAVASVAFDAARTGAFAVAAIGGGLTLAIVRIRAGPRRALAPGIVAAWAIVTAIWATIFFTVLPKLDPDKSPRPIAVAASDWTAPGEPVGLYGQRQLLGGLLFYGDRPVRVLETPNALAEFVYQGGRVVIAKSGRLDDLRAAGMDYELRAELRSGRRAQSLVEFRAIATAIDGP